MFEFTVTLRVKARNEASAKKKLVRALHVARSHYERAEVAAEFMERHHCRVAAWNGETFGDNDKVHGLRPVPGKAQLNIPNELRTLADRLEGKT